MFPFRWIPDERWRREPAYLMVLRADPTTVRPAVSVQSGWNRSRGIVRGLKESDVLLEDHTVDVLNEDDRPAPSPVRIYGAKSMRAQVWTGQQHVIAYRRAHPEERVLAWTGNGNLLSNPHFVAFEGSSASGALYCLGSELAYFGRRGRSYTCLVVRKPGHVPAVSIETLRFEDGAEGAHVYSLGGEEITAEIECATYGQKLVDNGVAIGNQDLVRMARDHEFYDLRHLFLFGRLQSGPDRWIDVGLSGFYDEQGHLDPGAVESALQGDCAVSEVGQFASELVHEAMMRKGYARVANPKASGEYSLENGVLTAVPLPGIYPHSMVGLDAGGSLIVAAIRGFSNRVGVSVRGAAEVMSMLGAQTAVMIDNGGDVMMSFEGEMVMPSSEGQRDRLRSILVYRTTRGPHELDCSALQLVRYPDQHAWDFGTG